MTSMIERWWTICLAVALAAPSLASAQHGGHGHGSSFGDHEDPPPRPHPPPKPEPPRPAEVYVLVDERGFSPKDFALKAGETTEIIVLRRTDRTCVKELLVPALDVNVALPLDRPVRFSVKPSKPGRLPFSCREGHVGGEIVVR
jgi:hypothetical protein